MKKILLTKGFFALVDDSDFDELSKFKWRVFKAKGHHTWYALRNLPRIQNQPRRTILMHRQILNAKRGEKIDHKNHDGLCNLRSNLRFANARQNSQNSMPSDLEKTSRFKGVRKSPYGWRSSIGAGEIRPNGRASSLNLGCFEREEDAARAYDDAAIKYFGEFASPNFPLKKRTG